MIWLAGHIWPFLLLSALLGAGLVVVFSTTKVTVERWVTDAPAPAAEGDSVDEQVEEQPEERPSARVEEPASPFPVALSGDGPAPWEEEELWSRPAKVVSSGTAKGPQDEWADAAQNWRSWADEATGQDGRTDEEGEPGGELPWKPRREPNPADRDLFAADREAEGADDPFPHSEPVEAFRYDQPVDTPLPRSEDPFPFARPVEAAPLPPTDPFPPFGGPPSAPVPAADRPERRPEPVPEPEPEPEPPPASARHRGTPAPEARDGAGASNESPFGPGSAFAPYDGSMPPGFPVKGDATAKLFHPPTGRFYSRTVADVWFDSEESAEAAGFTRWDRRGTSSLDLGRSSSDGG